MQFKQRKENTSHLALSFIGLGLITGILTVQSPPVFAMEPFERTEPTEFFVSVGMPEEETPTLPESVPPFEELIEIPEVGSLDGAGTEMLEGTTATPTNPAAGCDPSGRQA